MKIMINFLCPGCNRKFEVADHLGGRIGSCPGCKTRFEIPTLEPEEEEPKPNPKKIVAEVDEEEPRSRRPSRTEGDDDRPRRKPIRAEQDDEEDDRPRRRREIDEDDEEDDRPRSSKKKKKRKKSRGESGSMFQSPAIRILAICVIVNLLMIPLAFIFPLILFLPLIIDYLLILAGSVMLLVVSFKEDSTQGVLCLLVPLYALYYMISRFQECLNSILFSVVGMFMLIPISIVMALVFNPFLQKIDLDQQQAPVNQQKPPIWQQPQPPQRVQPNRPGKLASLTQY